MRRLRVLAACVAAITAAPGPSVTVGASSAGGGAGGGSAVVRRRLFSDSELDAFADEVKRTGSALLRGVLNPTKLREIRKAYSSVLAARIERAGPDRGPARYYATPPFVMPFADPEIFQQPDILGVVRRLVGTEPVLCQWAGDTPMGIHHSDPRLPGPSAYQDVHRDAAPLYPVRGAMYSARCESRLVAARVATRGASVWQYRGSVCAQLTALCLVGACAHRCCTQDDPEFPEMPATQLAVNFPLVDVLPPADNMPTNGPTESIPGTHRLSVAEGQVHHPSLAAVGL